MAILATLTRDSIFTDFVVAEAASPDLSAASIRDLMGRLFEAGSVSVRPSVGLYLVGIGGIGGIVAGVLSRRVSPPASSTARFADTMVAGRAAGGQADSLGPAAGEDPRKR